MSVPLNLRNRATFLYTSDCSNANSHQDVTKSSKYQNYRGHRSHILWYFDFIYVFIEVVRHTTRIRSVSHTFDASLTRVYLCRNLNLYFKYSASYFYGTLLLTLFRFDRHSNEHFGLRLGGPT